MVIDKSKSQGKYEYKEINKTLFSTIVKKYRRGTGDTI